MKIREYIVLQDEDGFLHFGDELIRCKDCKWVRKAGTLIGENPVPVYGCHNTGVYVLENGYCDVGERREE